MKKIKPESDLKCNILEHICNTPSYWEVTRSTHMTSVMLYLT